VTARLEGLLPHIVTAFGGGLTLKQFPNGSCIIGGGWQGNGDPAHGRKDIELTRLGGNLRLCLDIVPRLSQARIVRCWAAFNGDSPDEMPIAGSVPGRPGLFVALAGEAGFLAGPLVGRLMAELIWTGQVPSLLANFGLRRISRPA